MRLAAQADLLLRSRDPSVLVRQLRRGELLLLLCLGCLAYGGVMGSYSGHLLQPLYSAIKLPILLLGATLICLPSFFVLNTLLGLREDLNRVVHGIWISQVCMALVLASLAPFTALCYLSSANYFLAGVCNGLMFLIAAAGAQLQLRRIYRPLVRQNHRHRLARRAWLLLYCFVSIQMAWMLRPFIGDPNYPASLFRAGVWDNAYVVVWNDVYRLLTR